MSAPTSALSAFDLRAAARRAVIQGGFDPDWPPAAAQQLASLASAQPGASTDRDLRGMLWSSIDDDTSRDLDQIEVADAVPGGGIRVCVAIADVDALVPRGSPLDVHAARNGTTVYTGVMTFPMLPELLSTDRTSLAPDQDRRAIVAEMTVAIDGSTSAPGVYMARVRNGAQLTYGGVGAWLDGTGAAPSAVARQPALADQLRLQEEAARRLRARRLERGALELATIEANPLVRDGHVVGLEATRPGPARDLIEDFMIAANTVIAEYLAGQGRSSIRRVVRTPARWPRIVSLGAQYGVTLPAEPDGSALAAFLAARRAADPDRFPDLSLAVVKLLGPGEYVVDTPGVPAPGHFGLAVGDYTHGTAPNRRYADLVTERLVKATLAGVPAPYTDAELAAIAVHCTEQENNARKAARVVHKEAAAVLLAGQIGTVFDGIVTGVTDHGTFARILTPPAEGLVQHDSRHVDVGDRVRVRLVATDPSRGYIDFALA